MVENRDSVTLRWLLAAVLIIVTLVVYWPSLSGRFFFDDVDEILNNSDIRSIDSLLPSLLTKGRPLVYVSLWGNYVIGGEAVLGYHIVNLSIHLVAGLILFRLIAGTLRLPVVEDRFGDSAEWLAGICALIWMVHPLQTEAVTYIIQRGESMMALCFLLSLYCLMRGAQASGRGSRLWYVGGIVACWLGTGCKEVIIALPLVLVLYDGIFLSANWREIVRKRWWFHGGTILAGLWLLTFQFLLLDSALLGNKELTHAGFNCTSVTPLQYAATQPGVILHYLRLALFPSELCFDYRWPIAQGWGEVLVPGAVVLGLVTASLFALVYRQMLAFLGLSFFLVLAPTSSVLPIADIAVEHRMYLPLAAVVILCVLAVHAFIGRVCQGPRLAQASGEDDLTEERRLWLATGLVLLVVLMFGVRTWTRNHIYQNPVAFWSNVVHIAPHNDRALGNLAMHLRMNGEHELAVQHCKRAIEINPDSLLAYGNLAEALVSSGDVDGAIEAWKRALEIRPDYSLGQYRLSVLLASRGDWQSSVPLLQAYLEHRPDHARAHFGLGTALSMIGKPHESLRCFQRAAELEPQDPNFSLSLARLFADTGNWDQAIRHFRHTLSIDPTCDAACSGLEEAVRQQTADHSVSIDSVSM